MTAGAPRIAGDEERVALGLAVDRSVVPSSSSRLGLEGTIAQRAIEGILMRRLASYLALPIIVVDPEGDLVLLQSGGLPAPRW